MGPNKIRYFVGDFNGHRNRRPDGAQVTGVLGRGMGGSAAAGDAATGVLRSPPFTIARNSINFLIGGGTHARETCLNLVVDGRVVASTTGRNSDALTWAGWSVEKWKGRQAILEIVDRHSGPWGHVGVDHITFSAVLFDTRREHANWVEWGPGETTLQRMTAWEMASIWP
jgi:hypothetical protein